MNGGMLAICHNVQAGREDAVRDWYAREHHFERLGVPGFLEARRYERVSGVGGAMFGLYRVASPQVLQSEAYRARLAQPTPWTQATMPWFREMTRSVCHIASEAGRAEGGYLAAFACAQPEMPSPTEAVQALMALPGVLRVCCIVAEAPPTPTAAASAEMALRGGPDASIAWALIADTDSAQAAQAALEASHAMVPQRVPVQAAVYHLVFAARNPH